jgi:hypothetical protein
MSRGDTSDMSKLCKCGATVRDIDSDYCQICWKLFEEFIVDVHKSLDLLISLTRFYPCKKDSN